MVSIEDVTVAYGGYVLLDKINFHVSDNDKIGLVGKNGAGKSTVLKLICGLQSPTSGRIDRPADLSIGYLPQIMEHHKGRTVMEETMTAFDASAEIEREIAEVTRELETRTDYESDEYSALIEKLSSLHDRLDLSYSEPPEVQARKTLLGLGFRDDELGRRTETFSQGWNMRIELAKILLRKPRLLLLDEPTNHLDIESIEWLEDYLKGSRCSLLMVSHDRRFLDNVTNRTVAYENQQKMIQKTEEFIQAFRYKPTKSNQVQSRIKALEKLDRIEIDETDNVRLTVKFPPAPRSGDVVFRGTDLTVGYPGKVVFSHADIEIKRGEKVAFIGRNGEGKTTMMRVVTGELRPLDGEAWLGYNVETGYFAQNQEDVLDKNDTVYSTLDRIAVGDIRTKLRDILAQFLFRGEDIDKKVSVLSGGERARLGMAKLMLQSHNLLALDEPTNHMDIKSKDILKQALKAFDGTLIVVSHDRDFLDGLVDKMYEFRDGKVTEHLGGVSDFLEKRKLEDLKELERKFAPRQQASDEKKAAKEVRKAADEERRQGSRVDKKKKNRISWLENEIGKLEARMKDIENVLSAPKETDDIMELTRSYLELKRDLDAKTDEWAELMEEL